MGGYRQRQYATVGGGMIRVFENSKRILFFPKRWANAVSRWITGIHSPTGTINIRNTTSPDENGSMTIDVNVDAVAAKIRKLSQSGLSKYQRQDVKDVIRFCLDNVSVYWQDGSVSVNKDWLEKIVNGICDNLLKVETTESMELASGYEYASTPGSKYSDTFSASGSGGAGAKIYLCTRGAGNDESAVMHFREVSITSDGRIYAIGPEQEAISVYPGV